MADLKYHWAIPASDPSKHRNVQACGRKYTTALAETAVLFMAKVKANSDWYCSDCARAARLALAKESAPKPADIAWPKPRPISEAPTDGTPVIAYWSEQEYPRMRGLRWGVAKYGSGLVWFNEHNEPLSTPTHFLPLPPSQEVK